MIGLRHIAPIAAAGCCLIALAAPPALAKRKAGLKAFGGDEWIEFHEDVPVPHPSAAQEKDGFILFQRSILERIYQQSKPRASEIVSSVTLAATRDEYEAAQVAVYPLHDLQQVKVSVSDLKDAAQHVLPASEIAVRMVRYYGVPLSIRVAHRFGVVPKTLELAVPIDAPKGQVRPYWITVHVPPNQAGGHYAGTITFAHAGGSRSIDLGLDVIPVAFDEPDVLYGTLSINALAHLSRALSRSGSDDDVVGEVPAGRATVLMHQADLIFADQRRHGMTTINPRSDKIYDERNGHPYLPDLEVGIELYKKYRFPKPMVYFPVNLLKTNKIDRSWNYKEYDPAVHIPMARKIASYYTKRFHDEGLPGIIFVPVEEPNVKKGVGRLDPPDIRQKMAHDLSKAMRESGASLALTCTPESVKCAIDYLDYWIMAFKRFTPKAYELAHQNHAKLAIYANATMMGQGTYFTRFLFGYFTWANDIKGMLPWTYPMQPNRFPRNLGNKGEGGLNVHEGFIGPDDIPIPTIQWELSREGIDDAKYLFAIEHLVPRARAAGSPAATAAADEAEHFLKSVRAAVSKDVTRYVFEDDDTLEPIPEGEWTAEHFEQTRRKSAEILGRLLTAALPDPASK